MAKFYTLEQADQCLVGFSRDEFEYHQGLDGLKYYLIVAYFRTLVSPFGVITFTMSELLNNCGYSSKTRNESAYLVVKQIIQNEIIGKGYATSEQDIMTVKPNQIVHLQLSYDKDLFSCNERFVMLSTYEFNKIVNTNSNVAKSILVGVYMAIKQYIQPVNQKYMSHIAYPTHSKIRSSIGNVSQITITNAIKVLEDIELLYVKRGLYVNNEQDKEFLPNIYALRQEDLTMEIINLELGSKYKYKPIQELGDTE